MRGLLLAIAAAAALAFWTFNARAETIDSMARPFTGTVSASLNQNDARD